MSETEKESIAGSAERIADRGRDQFGFDVVEKPSLRDPDIAADVVNEFCLGIAAIRLAFSKGDIDAEKSKDDFLALVKKFSNIIMGGDDNYAKSTLHNPNSLGIRIQNRLPAVVGLPDDQNGGDILFFTLGLHMLNTADLIDGGKITDEAAKAQLTGNIASIIKMVATGR